MVILTTACAASQRVKAGAGGAAKPFAWFRVIGFPSQRVRAETARRFSGPAAACRWRRRLKAARKAGEVRCAPRCAPEGGGVRGVRI